MPTEYEESSNTVTTFDTVTIRHMEPNNIDNLQRNEEMPASATNGHNDSGSSSSGGRRTSITSPDPTAYVAKARITRPTPPPPSYNPMQFVQIKPCNLYQTAQQQLKKAEEVKKIKEIKKEEPEDWQNNLDNWKSSRRKRVEHIIDRVVEVKKLELEEHDRSRRKSKTFSEMIEERGERGVRVGRAKLASLAVYNEDETNDLSDLGIGTSSASGKSSLSEDYDNNSVMSDNADLEKVLFENSHLQSNTIREYVSSPGYDTSSSTAPTSSPDPCEYTYEGAIEDYKQRVSRAASGTSTALKFLNNKIPAKTASIESTPQLRADDLAGFDLYPARRGSKIEERLIGFEVSSPNDSQDLLEKNKVDVPKIDISKRKEMFEQQKQVQQTTNSYADSRLPGGGCNGVPRVTLRDHFKLNETSSVVKTHAEVKRLSGDMTSIRDRLLSLEQQKNLLNPTNDASKPMATNVVDVPVPPLKERLSSLHNAATKEEVKKPPVVLVDARQLEIMKDEEERNAKQRMKQMDLVTNQTKTTTTRTMTTMTSLISTQSLQPSAQIESSLTDDKLAADNGVVEFDRDDSGIQTSDDVEEERNVQLQQLPTQEQQQLNEAIAALAIEEKQLEQAASAVNQIEAEFAEFSNSTNTKTTSSSSSSSTNNEQPCETMEFSIDEALELALEAIDKEASSTIPTTTTKTTKMAMAMATATVISKEQPTPALIHNHKSNNIDMNPMNQFHQNQTDEERAEVLHNNKVLQLQNNEAQKDLDQQIQNEPIYENVSTTTSSIAQNVDADEQIIPNRNKIGQQNKEKSNANMKNNYNNNNNSKNIDVTTTTPINHSNNLSSSTRSPRAAESHNDLDSVSSDNRSLATVDDDDEPYYQVPKCGEPYYDAPKHLRPIPVYENIDIFYSGLEQTTLATDIGATAAPLNMEPPKEKPPPPPTDSPPIFDDVDSVDNGDNWSSDNTYETITNRLSNGLAAATMAGDPHPSPPIKRLNSTKRIKKELRHKRSSFLGIEGTADDDLESYLELTVAPPPDMAQLLQEERRLEKQLYMKAGLCDSSDTGESRDSGVSENHSRQSSEPFTNSSEEADRTDELPLSLITVTDTIAIKPNEVIYQNEAHLLAAQTPLLQTVKGNSAESWTESATVAAAATKSLTEATATANAKMLSIEEKIREQEEVLRVERELLHLEQEELKRQRENLMMRESLARRELQHGAKMLMSANRRSLQDLNAAGGGGIANAGAGLQPTSTNLPIQVKSQPQPQQIYANVSNLQQQQQQQPQYYIVESDYRKSMSDLNEFSKRLMAAPQDMPIPPTKPMRAMQMTIPNGHDDYGRARLSANTQSYGGSLVKIANPANSAVTASSAVPRQTPMALYPNNQSHQSTHNLTTSTSGNYSHNGHLHTNMTRNTLHALSATPKPKYTDGWVQVQNRKSFDSNLSNDPAWLLSYQQKRKSVPDAYHFNSYSTSNGGNSNNLRFLQENEQQRRSLSTATTTPIHQQNGGGISKPLSNASSNGKPLPDSIIQTLTERLQSKGIGERKRFDNYVEKNASSQLNLGYHQPKQMQQQQPLLSSHAVQQRHPLDIVDIHNQATISSNATTGAGMPAQDKVLSVSGKKKCSHCGDELGRGAAMIIESLLLFYHINCFKCCVCHVQLGDGLNGTDVRVRNHKLHCQNCYSSDDGIKFSCV